MTLSHKGTDLGELNDASHGAFAAKLTTQAISDAKAGAIQDMFDNPFASSTQDNHLVPVVDQDGNVASYRYLMSEIIKDELLEKDNDAMEVLGAMHAATEEKVNSKVINTQLMKVLGDAYKEDLVKGNVANYIEISNQSSTKEDKELWGMMPDSAKQAAMDNFGSNRIMVRRDLYTNAFGYREFSMADAARADKDAPKAVEWLVQNTLVKLFGRDTANKIKTRERVVVELVKELKDIIVIRSGVVLVENMISNTVQLVALHGVPAMDAARNQYKAFIAAQEHVKVTGELRKYRLLAEQATGAKLSQYRNKVVELEEMLANNPTSDLIAEGLLQTIVEDASITKESYTYKDGLVGRFNEGVEKLNPVIRGPLKELLITKDTDGYKMAQLMISA